MMKDLHFNCFCIIHYYALSEKTVSLIDIADPTEEQVKLNRNRIRTEKWLSYLLRLFSSKHFSDDDVFLIYLHSKNGHRELCNTSTPLRCRKKLFSFKFCSNHISVRTRFYPNKFFCRSVQVTPVP